MIDLKLGDCMEKMLEIQEKNVDLIVADPPYKICMIGGGDG